MFLLKIIFYVQSKNMSVSTVFERCFRGCGGDTSSGCFDKTVGDLLVCAQHNGCTSDLCLQQILSKYQNQCPNTPDNPGNAKVLPKKFHPSGSGTYSPKPHKPHHFKKAKAIALPILITMVVLALAILVALIVLIAKALKH